MVQSSSSDMVLMVNEILSRIDIGGSPPEAIADIVKGKLRDRESILNETNLEKIKNNIVHAMRRFAEEGSADLILETAEYYREKYKN